MLLQTARTLFLLLIFSLPLVQPFHFYFSGYTVPLTDFIFLATVSVWTLAVLLRQTRLKLGAIYLPLGVYLLVLIVATVFAENVRASFIKFLGAFYLIALAALAYNLADFEFLKKIARAWLAATTVVVIISLITLVLFYVDRENALQLRTLSHYGTLPPGNYPRIQSTFLNPNMMCNYLNISVMFALILAARARSNRFLRAAWCIGFAIAVFFTLSPGIGGILLCAGIWLWLAWGKQSVKGRLALTAGVMAAVLFFLVTLFALDAQTGGINVAPRVRLWQQAFENILANPLTGRGLGAAAANVTYLDPSGNLQRLTDAHQIWLNTGAQTGFFGLAAILFLTVRFARKLFPLCFENEAARWRVGLALAFFGAFVYQGLAGSYEDARHIWVLMGLLAAASEFRETAESS